MKTLAHQPPRAGGVSSPCRQPFTNARSNTLKTSRCRLSFPTSIPEDIPKEEEEDHQAKTPELSESEANKHMIMLNNNVNNANKHLDGHAKNTMTLDNNKGAESVEDHLHFDISARLNIGMDNTCQRETGILVASESVDTVHGGMTKYSPSSLHPHSRDFACDSQLDNNNGRKVVGSSYIDSSTLHDNQSNDRMDSPETPTKSTTVSEGLCIKSGVLVFLRTGQELLTPTNSPSLRASLNKSPLQRMPVTMKVHRKGYDRYAIVNCTKRFQMAPLLYMQLRNSRTFISGSNPAQFSISGNKPDGKIFTFEANNPEDAAEWVKVLSVDESPSMLRRNALRFSPPPTQSDTTDTPSPIPDHDQEISPRTPPFRRSQNSRSPKLPLRLLMPVLSEAKEEGDDGISRNL